MIEFHDDMTLGEVKTIMRHAVRKGIHCPGCTQHAKIYRRKINSTMARALITLWRAGEGFHHGPSLRGDTHELSQLKWWELIEEEPIVREDGGRAGYWRITEKGEWFVKGESMLPRIARIYDSKVLNLVGEPVNIRHCLGSRFNYEELMEGR
jgi:hypothetical protein